MNTSIRQLTPKLYDVTCDVESPFFKYCYTIEQDLIHLALKGQSEVIGTFENWDDAFDFLSLEVEGAERARENNRLLTGVVSS